MVGAALCGLALSTSAYAKDLPKDMQGRWCGGEGDGVPGRMMYFDCQDDERPTLEVKGGTMISEGDAGCVAVEAKPFNLYLVRASGVYVNAWGPGMAITFRCRVEDGRPFTKKEYWQIFKGGLVTDEKLPGNARRNQQ